MVKPYKHGLLPSHLLGSGQVVAALLVVIFQCVKSWTTTIAHVYTYMLEITHTAAVSPAWP